MDKDGLWLDDLDDMVFEDWKNSLITNEMRNHMHDVIRDVRDWL